METSKPLAGKVVALPETRELDKLAEMLEREGASTVRCPLVAILDAPDAGPIEAWLQELVAGKFADVLFYTGEGLRRLLGFAEAAGIREEVVEALRKVRKITRGPKPARALKEIGLAPDVAAVAPTTDGLVETLKGLGNVGSIGVQLFSAEVPAPLAQALAELGTAPAFVSPYIYAPKSDGDHVVRLIDKLASGAIDVVAFTSASQVDRLYEVANENGLHDALKEGLAKTRVAAVGPVVAENLSQRGVSVSIAPTDSFFMKPLVNAIVAALAE